ncbi:hypothetical protein PAEPH01_1943 [Pancytospora epiphaga]|nr:hypothetical protein PAEPH01_1943 [Pancytospora epiphaga]
MMKISIVPDTNVFISNLQIVEALLNYEFPWLCTLNISRTVLDELDRLKKFKPAARRAIRYIQSVALSLKVELEGRVDDRKLDVEIECKESIMEKINDDKILNYVFKLENPVLITNDVSFALRCSSFNIYVISAMENDKDLVISRILECFDVDRDISVCELKQEESLKHTKPVTSKLDKKIENSEQIEPSCSFDMAGLSPLRNIEDLDRFRHEFKHLIEPVIFRVLFTEVGDNFMTLLSESSPEYYLNFIKTHYNVFKSYLPKNSCSVIEKFLSALKNKNLKQIISNARVLLVSFGYLPSNG